MAILGCCAGWIAAGDAPEPVEELYLTREAALREIFTQGETISAARLELTSEEKGRIEARLKRRLFEDRFEVYRGVNAAGSVSGYALITEEIGKFQPITFIAGITPKAAVKDVAVMVYRETIGSDVKRRRFLSQFPGMTAKDEFRLNRDIIHISGATLSSRAIARGVQKALIAIDECLLGKAKRQNLEWKGVAWKPLEEAKNPPIASAKDPPGAAPVRRVRYLMGTILEAVCYGDPAQVEPALQAAFAEVARLEGLLSTFREESEISQVNREAAARPVRVSADTLACVEAALEFSRRTAGAFDPTLARDGYQAVAIDREGSAVRFLRPGLKLDLGGIGKGYALDRAARVLEQRGMTRALFNFGGQVLALDAPPGLPAWIVPVRDPERDDRLLGHYEIVRASVSTSGNYERGKHILDPRTMRPAEGVLSATVCARSATDADALSTSLDVLGAEAAPELLKAVAGGAALVVPAAGKEPFQFEAPGGPRFVRAPPPH
ncbi:MAG: FAD:protein FMN transferase [Planctomycetes bacterium]|nr:FAD:protein FMN transferase [Planctomycetota bacterium]